MFYASLENGINFLGHLAESVNFIARYSSDNDVLHTPYCKIIPLRLMKSAILMLRIMANE